LISQTGIDGLNVVCLLLLYHTRCVVASALLSECCPFGKRVLEGYFFAFALAAKNTLNKLIKVLTLLK
jgi:hypothetical protein